MDKFILLTLCYIAIYCHLGVRFCRDFKGMRGSLDFIFIGTEKTLMVLNKVQVLFPEIL